ncbi:sigma-54-dependent transcriptional regulator [Spirosoma endophyticum]|uniref:DNA-binding transcriptional response regulator, NtrC family, contains REC, AAA-type ATPase, and a Fis-type DNA-binding domains n=1 Tax=Spirosoma endophyticum TaxID=662367 RepID=A0A1I1URW4_9BACT|nr:sigma-54 dependent transcriptional regulator [Spirosoma endophyticum]SFD70730.1 DNA-binding transcriptional response regulator, NtrC family, contains REC, AAA-type ATPase, and a Fis-type DNA-binding domains [Spirosoma endophyticum]
MAATILIIDDEPRLRQLLARILQLEGYTVLEADTARSGLKTLEHEEVQLVISDVKLPDKNGIELSAQIKQLYPATEIIVLTAYGTISDGVTAIKNGAFDYITKGDDNDRIIPLVSRAVEKANLQFRIKQLEQQVGQRYGFDSIIGRSKPIQQAIELARKVAVTDTTVLLTGETGTGKEVFAQAIHQASFRRTGPFVAINCGALGKDILESELFGHRSGAFTGANRDQKGLFAEANKGTIFLDEIGEMPLDLQAKLLRVLETHEFLRVGDTKPTKTDVRVIAATNRGLEQEATAGRFRLDLYYRLSVFQIELPPLRDRRTDIPELADQFARQSAAKIGKRIVKLSPTFVQKLQQHAWKGNIRELKNVIERAVILADTSPDGSIELTPDLLPYEIQENGLSNDPTALDLATVEQQHIRRVLRQTNGNKTETARLLGIGLTTLYRKLQEAGLSDG